jgi:hypothetical protein
VRFVGAKRSTRGSKARGYCDAITFIESAPGIDPNAIAIWGDSYSAAEAIVPDPGSERGKTMRMRAVMDHAMAHDRKAGAKLVYRLVCSIRGHGGFREGDPAYIGEAAYLNLRDAYRASSFELDSDGELRPRLLDSSPALESDEVRPHQLRHAHAVETAREGVALVVIQRQLGHANLGSRSRRAPGSIAAVAPSAER